MARGRRAPNSCTIFDRGPSAPRGRPSRLVPASALHRPASSTSEHCREPICLRCPRTSHPTNPREREWLRHAVGTRPWAHRRKMGRRSPPSRQCPSGGVFAAARFVADRHSHGIFSGSIMVAARPLAVVQFMLDVLNSRLAESSEGSGGRVAVRVGGKLANRVPSPCASAVASKRNPPLPASSSPPPSPPRAARPVSSR